MNKSATQFSSDTCLNGIKSNQNKICNSKVKFMFSKKYSKLTEIFTVDLTLCSKCQIDGEDFISFCGLPRKHELYHQQIIVIS